MLDKAVGVLELPKGSPVSQERVCPNTSVMLSLGSGPSLTRHTLDADVDIDFIDQQLSNIMEKSMNTNMCV